jgi:uncharacterized membrane protein
VIETVKAITVWLAAATEGIAGLIIAVAVVEASAQSAFVLFRYAASRSPERSHLAKEEVRLRLGRWLALALEFELAADILRTAVAPTWSEIGQLAAIAAIRTALNFFLQQEIDKAAVRRDAVDSLRTAPPPPPGPGGATPPSARATA